MTSSVNDVKLIPVETRPFWFRRNNEPVPVVDVRIALTTDPLDGMSTTSSINKQRRKILSAADKVDTIIIGAGVIGLAIARAIVTDTGTSCFGATNGKRTTTAPQEVVLIDRAGGIGTETSSRNSAVIHAGIYYPYKSLKGQLCVKGKLLLYQYCTNDNRVPIHACGKLIVANNESQASILRTLELQAAANGVYDLHSVSSKQIKDDYEADIMATHGALFSPSTGIIDAHALMEQFRYDIDNPPNRNDVSATIALRTKVVDGYIDTTNTVGHSDDPYRIYVGTTDTGGAANATATTTVTATDTNSDDINNDNPTLWLACRRLINCSGLWSSQVASYFHPQSLIPTTSTQHQHQPRNYKHQWSVPTQYFCRGSYYKIRHSKTIPQPLFRHLIYPVPDLTGDGLGIHATIDLSEPPQIKFGPDIEWLDANISNPDRINMEPNVERAQLFYNSIRTYWPSIQEDTLIPDYTGVRPKLEHPSLFTGGGGNRIGGSSRSSNGTCHNNSNSNDNNNTFQDFMIVGPKVHGIPGLVHLFGMESPGLTSSMAIANYVVRMLKE